MLTNLLKFPAQTFGGKRHAAPLVWSLLGDVAHYVEPLCRSCAVLLERPHPCNRPYYSESVNDIDGFCVNALRSIQLHPQATAEAASWYVSEADYHARHLALLAWAADQPLERLMGDPAWCDPQMAGWWLYGQSCHIGSGWCSGVGPWHLDRATGRMVRRGTEPGIERKLPHLSKNGQGVHRPQAREPGVGLTDARPPGTEDWQLLVAADYAATEGMHPMTMPELRRWFHVLSARLRHVRILHGDWRRVVTTGTTKTLMVREGKGVCGLFFDPPYAKAERDVRLYTSDQTASDVATDVRAWCLAHGNDPDYRIVLAGFVGEGHEVLESAGWHVYEWFQAGHLRGGMGNTNQNDTHQQVRERLWASPHCLRPDGTDTRQLTLGLALDGSHGGTR